MSPAHGRPPSLDPKDARVGFRLSETSINHLNSASELLGLSKSEIVRIGIEKVYRKALRESLKKRR